MTFINITNDHSTIHMDLIIIYLNIYLTYKQYKVKILNWKIYRSAYD